MLGSIDDWKRLAEPVSEPLVAEATAAKPHDAAAVARLRKHWDAELVRLALVLAEARRKGQAKFGSRAAHMWADPQGMEMASSALAAGYKAGRFRAAAASAAIADLCCGIGGDAVFLATHAAVTAVDREPVRAWMTGMNAGCSSTAADVTTFDAADRAIHIDPSRRDESSRSRMWSLDAMSPGVEVVRQMLAASPHGGAVKLSPGADLRQVASAIQGCSVEVISENGRLTQALAWTGAFRKDAPRTATLLLGTPDVPLGFHSLSGTGDEHALVRDPGPARYLFEPDDSVERAGLLGVLTADAGAALLHERVGLLTADSLVHSPWLTPFEVLEHLPWSRKRVASAICERDAGIVEVKTRGGVVNPDELQPALSGAGDNPLVLFVLRFGSSLHAIIARRVAPTRPPASPRP